MKKFPLLIFIAMVFTSCKIYKIPDKHNISEPYVQTKTGNKFVGSEVSRENGFFKKDKISLPDKSILSKNVAFYNDGYNVYANVGRKVFAKQIDTGKINLYLYRQWVTDQRGHSHPRSYYYIQKEPLTPVKFLTYKNLKPMVEPKTPAFKMLVKYNKTRNVQRILGYGSLASIIGGFILAGNNNDKISNIGVTMGAVGFMAFPAWFITLGVNRGKLMKAVYIADKDL